MPARIAALRRYPVKSMGGESLERVALDARGLEGDRWLAVRDADGRLASGKSTRRFRRYDEVFAFSAATSPDGSVVVSDASERWQVGDPRLDAALGARLGAEVRVVPEASSPHHDAGAVSLIGTATLAWCAEAWGVDADPRRLRANVVVSTDEPFVEERWVGETLAVGRSRVRVAERITRCRTIDLAQDGATERTPWLRHLARDRSMALAVYADVVEPGEIAIADAIEPIERGARQR